MIALSVEIWAQIVATVVLCAALLIASGVSNWRWRTERERQHELDSLRRDLEREFGNEVRLLRNEVRSDACRQRAELQREIRALQAEIRAGRLHTVSR